MCPSVSLYVSLFRAIFVSLGLSLPCPMSLSLFLSSLLSCPSLPISLSPSLFLPLYDTLKKMLPSNTAHEKLTRKKKRRHWTNQIKHATHEHCSRVSVDFFFLIQFFLSFFFCLFPVFFSVGFSPSVALGPGLYASPLKVCCIYLVYQASIFC